MFHDAGRINDLNDTGHGTCGAELADRLGIGRVGIIPHERYMSTVFGNEVAWAGSFYPFL